MNECLKNELSNALDGLTYGSESDYPFDIVDHVEQPESADPFFPKQFFEALIANEGEYYKSEEVVKLKTVWALLSDNLTDLVGFRTGSIEVQVYIVGRDKASGCLCGLHTVSVET